jgi:hypothetical protein
VRGAALGGAAPAPCSADQYVSPVADEEVVGKVGRVTGTVAPDVVGEVMIPIRGGTEAFNARPADGETLTIGSRIVVVDYFPPRTVFVSPV